MSATSLEVVERLEAVEVGGSLRQRQKPKAGHGLFVVGVVRHKLRQSVEQAHGQLTPLTSSIPTKLSG